MIRIAVASNVMISPTGVEELERKVKWVTDSVPETFQVLFRQYYPEVLRKLVYLVRDRTIAEDLAQDVFLRLYRQPPDELAAVGGWLHRVSTRIAYDHLRQRSRRAKLSERGSIAGDVELYDVSSELEVLKQTERETVARVLKRLSDRDRQILLLRYSDYSYKEIAEIIGVRPEIMGAMLSRALGRFKRAYYEEGGGQNDGHAKESAFE